MFAISPTDLNWFQQLRTEGLQGNVINFWTPTPWNISHLKSGDNLYCSTFWGNWGGVIDFNC